MENVLAVKYFIQAIINFLQNLYLVLGIVLDLLFFSYINKYTIINLKVTLCIYLSICKAFMTKPTHRLQ